MKAQSEDNTIQKEIDHIFTTYQKEAKERKANFRNNLEDKYYKKIFDALLKEAPLKKQVIRPKFKYNEIYNLVKDEMTKPTLDLHLKHLEQKGFINKKSLTKYKTFYQVNVTTEPKVIQIRKTIFGKQRLELVGISKTKKGELHFPPNLKLAPASDVPPDERLFYKD
jgi:DNA-binding HxlR family transcriptional regulator